MAGLDKFAFNGLRSGGHDLFFVTQVSAQVCAQIVRMQTAAARLHLFVETGK